MKFLADESVDSPIVKKLRSKGYYVKYILEDNHGITDIEVLKISQNYNLLLITADKDFGELIYRLKKLNNGVILYRLSGLSNIEKQNLIIKMIDKYSEKIENSFTVITKTHIRIKQF